jgi:methylenetetrahydrofolate reductase (NADPH)
MPPTTSARTQRTAKAAIAHALRSMTYEIMPFKGTEDQVLAHVPRDVALTVTVTEAKGLETTLALATSLSSQGYVVAPHISARLVRDRAELADIADRLKDSGIDRIFCIGGDAPEAAGEFPDALSLLTALDESGRSFSSIGIGGYPEGHGLISDELIERALSDKAPHATQILTQLCFDPDTIVRWAERVKASGVDLPIRVGIPGAISRQKLIRVSARLGLGQSARFLEKQSNMFWRFFLPGGYSPNKLVDKLSPVFGSDSRTHLEGFHVFTFNDLESTEAWRQARLAKLKTAELP